LNGIQEVKGSIPFRSTRRITRVFEISKALFSFYSFPSFQFQYLFENSKPFSSLRFRIGKNLLASIIYHLIPIYFPVNNIHSASAEIFLSILPNQLHLWSRSTLTFPKPLHTSRRLNYFPLLLLSGRFCVCCVTGLATFCTKNRYFSI
jgi:hypothetical protein